MPCDLPLRSAADDLPAGGGPRRPPVALRTVLLVALMAFACSGCASRPTRAASTPANPPTATTTAVERAKPLFDGDGIPAGWEVRSWNDISQPAPPGSAWRVVNGVLTSGSPRGNWLVSTKEYGDFRLEFDIRLGERGNSGVGLRLPPAGEPSVEGLEVQWVDPRYYGTNYTGKPWEFTGALFKSAPPSAQVYRPVDWNQCVIECRGPRVTVQVNGTTVVSINLDESTESLPAGKPLAQRPRRGRLAFQDIGRGGGQVEIRHPRIVEWD